MRNAPSVNYPVGRSRFALVAVLVCALVALAALVLWLVQGPAPGWRQALVGASLAAWTCLAGFQLRRMPRGELAWDGAAWRWSDAAGSQPVVLEVACDLQSFLLLRARATDGAALRVRWLWLQKDADTPAWQALRRAVYFRAGQQAQPGAASAVP